MLLGVVAFMVLIVVGLSWAFSEDVDPGAREPTRGGEPGSIAIPRRVTIAPPSTPGVLVLRQTTNLEEADYVVRVVKSGGSPAWFEPASSDAALAYVVD